VSRAESRRHPLNVEAMALLLALVQRLAIAAANGKGHGAEP
jgi:hypothetical protein